MDLKDPHFLFEVFKWLWLLAISVVVWLRRPGEDASKAVAALRIEMEANHQANQLEAATLKERIDHMPTKEVLAELAGSVKALAVGQEMMVHQMRLMQQHLMNGKDT